MMHLPGRMVHPGAEIGAGPLQTSHWENVPAYLPRRRELPFAGCQAVVLSGRPDTRVPSERFASREVRPFARTRQDYSSPYLRGRGTSLFFTRYARSMERLKVSQFEAARIRPASGAPSSCLLARPSRSCCRSAQQYQSPELSSYRLDDAAQHAPVVNLVHRLANLHGNPPGGILVHLEVARQLEG